MNVRQILMGQPNPVSLGQSGTGMYEYARKPVIVTTDEDAVWTPRKWLEANVVAIYAGERVYDVDTAVART